MMDCADLHTTDLCALFLLNSVCTGLGEQSATRALRHTGIEAVLVLNPAALVTLI